ncbi:MAG: hypothetical protein JSV19_11520 [Phycisphaerales bacterium]|nr:MAG: hypothetical protein JSV19_11520 [Phycisphaerales bacterium]
MRVGEVIGTVTLAHRLENIAGGRFMIVQPRSAAAIKGEAGATAEPVVAYDELSTAVGSVVGISEGREAAMPFHPRLVPVDAYCAAIIDEVQIQ